MLIAQYIQESDFKDFSSDIVERLIWLATKLGFQAVKRKHGGMLLLVSRKKIKSNYIKIKNNRLDQKSGRFFFDPDVEEMIVSHGVEDGAILIDKKGCLIDNNCALPLDFKRSDNGDKPPGGVRRATALNVTKRFKGLAVMIRSNGLVSIVYQGSVIGIVHYKEMPFGNIVPLVEKVDLDYFPEISSFPPKLWKKVYFANAKKMITRMQGPFDSKLDFFEERNQVEVEWELDRHQFQPRITHAGTHIADNMTYLPPPRPPVPEEANDIARFFGKNPPPTMARKMFDLIVQFMNSDNLLSGGNTPRIIQNSKRERTVPLSMERSLPHDLNINRAISPNSVSALVNGLYSLINNGKKDEEDERILRNAVIRRLS